MRASWYLGTICRLTTLRKSSYENPIPRRGVRVTSWSSATRRPRSHRDSGCSDATVDGIINAMRTAIDGAGRIVVPKPLRDALGLSPGQVLEITAGDGRLEIVIAATPMILSALRG